MGYLTKKVIGAALITMGYQVAHAGAFSLYTEASPAGVGNYAAGIAAEAGDAATAWYNPAGLVLLNKQQLLFGGVGVLPSHSMTGTTTFSTIGVPPYRETFTDLNGKKDAVVPSIHYALPLGDSAAFGVSLISPFGLSTDWGPTSPLRYSATLTELQTIDLSPDIAGKLTEHLSFGIGVDLEWAKVRFNRVLGNPALLQPFQALGARFTPTTFDSYSNNKGQSFGVGFHTGLMTTFNENHTRVGLNYQSSISHTFEGSSVLIGRLADPALTNPDVAFWGNTLRSNNIEFPDILTLSGYQDINSQLALLGSIVYTGWSSIKNLQLFDVAAFSPAVGTTYVDSTSTQNYHDAWRFAAGANYHVNNRLMLRVGGGYDQTPTNNADRDVRLPDANRWALAAGAHYQIWPRVGFDLGYAYLFASPSLINKTEPFGATSSFNVNSRTNAHAQLIGLQVVWTIDEPVPPVNK